LYKLILQIVPHGCIYETFSAGVYTEGFGLFTQLQYIG